MNLSNIDFKQIKLIAFDIDGTLTDGSIYIGSSGEELKVFNVKDGYGIKAAEKIGIKTFFITGRPAYAPTIQRLKDLNIDLSYLRHSVSNKVTCAEEILLEMGLSFCNMAFMGDDLPDLDLLKKVAFAGAPNDAIKEVKNNVHFVSTLNAGKGAAREFVDVILSGQSN